MCRNEVDFGMPAEWHFFATSDGKGPCDGVGGTVSSLTGPGVTDRVVNFATIKGYFTARYDGSWWLACTTKTMPDSGEVEV